MKRRPPFPFAVATVAALPARAGTLDWIGDANGGNGVSLFQEINWSTDGDTTAPHEWGQIT